VVRLVSSPRYFLASALIASALLPLANGCCALSRLGPTDENEIAARELARLGLNAVHRGELVEASARFVHALKKCPDNPQARHHLAELLWKQGDRERAIQEMDLAVRKAGGDPEWTVTLGRMLLSERSSAAALECADRALRTSPDLASAWLLRGDVMRAQDRPDEAKLAYHRGLSTRSPTPSLVTDSVLHLSELYRLEGKPLRALATLERLEQSLASPDDAPTGMRYEQAIALHALGRHHHAIEKFEQARRGLGDDLELLLMLADCQYQSGQYDAAQETTLRLATIAPTDSRVSALQANLRNVGHRIAGTP
jgi:tetratricopeptide (TPR) repeat protein